MDTFGFTKKKFLSLAEKNRHGHLISWLSEFYQKLSASRVTDKGFSQFLSQYETLLTWMPGPEKPAHVSPAESDDTRSYMAYVSDAIHFHRQAAGLTAKDHNLLEPVVTGDRSEPNDLPPDIEYQVALDGLRSLFNVGSIFRTCEAVGVKTIILGNTLGKENPQVRKTAMGSQEWLSQEKTQDLAQTLGEKKADGFRIIGVETMAGSAPCHGYAWPKKAILVVGNEEYGISPHVLRVVEDMVHIPMYGKKNSLNVANATTAILYQAVLSLDTVPPEPG